jgi:hypothetical protein
MHRKFEKDLIENPLANNEKEQMFPRSSQLKQVLTMKEFYELARHADTQHGMRSQLQMLRIPMTKNGRR